MPLSALAALFFVLFPLRQAGFAAAVTEVPQANTSPGSNPGSAAGSLPPNLNAPQPVNLALPGSVLPTVGAPQATPPALENSIAAPRAPAATVKDQLDDASKQAGEVAELLQKPAQAGEASIEQTNTKAGKLFDAAKPSLEKPDLDAAAAQGVRFPAPSQTLSQSGRPGLARAPPSSALGALEAALPGAARLAQAAKTPAAYKDLSRQVVEALQKPSELSLKSKAVYQRSDAAAIGGMQTSFKNALLAQARQVVLARGLPEKAVITHGTTLQGLLGMILTDGIKATSSHPGFSGESPAVWGAYGLDVGAGYGATRGVAKGQPGVTIIIFNPQEPIKIVRGQAISRAPSVSKDFLAAVISDGQRTLVLDQAALRALAASAAAWKSAVVQQAHQGSMREFSEWERLKSFYAPN